MAESRRFREPLPFLLIASSAAVLGCVTAIALLYRDPRVSTGTPRHISSERIEEVMSSLECYSHLNGKLPSVASTFEQAEFDRLRDALFSKDAGMGFHAYWGFEYALLDGWGRNLNVVIDVEHAGAVRVGNRLLRLPYAIWSNGENGKNEYGAGDDLRSWHEGVPGLEKAVF